MHGFALTKLTGLFDGSEAAGRGEVQPLRAAAVRQQHLQPTTSGSQNTSGSRGSKTSKSTREALDALHAVQQESLGSGLCGLEESSWLSFSFKVKNENPELKLWEIGRIIGQMWRDLPEQEKAEFTDEYEGEKVEYERNLKIYHNSPAYQQYMTAKARGQAVVEEPQDPIPQPNQSRGGKNAERRIDIQPAEDEEDPDDGLSVKHVAHAR